MHAELDVLGAFVPAIAVWFVLSLAIFVPADTVRFALFVCLFCGGGLVASMR